MVYGCLPVCGIRVQMHYVRRSCFRIMRNDRLVTLIPRVSGKCLEQSYCGITLPSCICRIYPLLHTCMLTASLINRWRYCMFDFSISSDFRLLMGVETHLETDSPEEHNDSEHS